MPPNPSRTTRRNAVRIAVAVGGAAALFASGVLVANAVGGDGQAGGHGPATELPLPAVARDGSSPAFGSGAGTVPTNQSAPGGVATDGGKAYPAGCLAPLGNVIAGGTIDPSQQGFAMRLLGDGFQLQSLGLQSLGDCGTGGRASSGELVLNTTWLETASGIEVSVSQRATRERSTNVRTPGSANFWVEGYAFTVSANSFQVLMPNAGPDRPAGPVTNGGSGSGGGVAVAPPGGGGNDPKAEAAIDHAIARLAPSLASSCFYVQASGGWNDLAAMGIGDPRPAVPAGFQQAYLQVVTFTPPAASCDTPKLEAAGSLSAAFVAGGGREGSVSVGAYPPGGGGFAGQINDSGANWTNGTWAFTVSGDRKGQPIGKDTVRALAKALDPGFDETCMVRTRELAAGDLAALGLHPAKAPSGWKQVKEHLEATEIPPACKNPPADFAATVSLAWSFEMGADTIEATANRWPAKDLPAPAAQGYISPGGLNWTGTDGTQYAVYGYSRGVSPSVSRDALIFVAKSMDPSLDPSKLLDAEKPVAIPAPAPGTRSE